MTQHKKQPHSSWQMFCAMLIAILIISCTKPIGSPGHSADNSKEMEKIPWNLSREGFIQECIFSEGTPRTPHFDDYTEGSYHVDKQDLISGIGTMRQKCPDIVAAFVGGPWGPLWAYEIITFKSINNSNDLQVNRVVFPHARIVFKSTKTIHMSEFESFFTAISCSASFAKGAPDLSKLKHVVGSKLDLEWNYDILFSLWRDSKQELLYSTENPHSNSSGIKTVMDSLNKLTNNMTPTYSIEYPDGFDMIISPKDK